MSNPKYVKLLAHFLIIILFIFNIVPLGLSQENVDIRVWLFKGVQIEGAIDSDKIEILSSFTHPELAALKSLIGRSEEEFKEGIINALVEIKSLKTLDDLWLFKRQWEGIRPSIGSAIIKNKLAFRIDLFRKQFSPPQLDLRAVISKSREGVIREFKSENLSAQDAYLATIDESKMDKIIDKDLLVLTGDPIVVGIPYKGETYFMALLATKAGKGLDMPAETKIEHPREAELFEAPRPVIMAPLPFPDELRQRGVSGDVRLRVTIDEKGKVESVDVMGHLHPYSDYSAVQSVMQWTFEPIVKKNKPIRAAFDYSIRFDSRLYEKGLSPLEDIFQGELGRIIDGCAKYSRKLMEMGLLFACEESISETRYRLKSEISHWEMKSYRYRERLSENSILGIPVQIMDPAHIEINRYVCDYQLRRTEGQVDERRILLKENGRKMSDWTKLLNEKRFSILNPFLDSLRIFSPEQRSQFAFRLLGEDKIKGKKAYVIEALPRSGVNSGVQSAKIWATKENYQILRSEMRGVPVDGYDDVLADSVTLNIRPEFLIIHEYKTEKNGVLYPERTDVKVEYPRPARNVLKYKSEIAYSKYKFFSAETQYEIIK